MTSKYYTGECRPLTKAEKAAIMDGWDYFSVTVVKDIICWQSIGLDDQLYGGTVDLNTGEMTGHHLCYKAPKGECL